MAGEVRKEMREATVVRLEHQCPACGEWYVPTRRDQVFCSAGCKAHRYRCRRKLAQVPRATSPYVTESRDDA